MESKVASDEGRYPRCVGCGHLRSLDFKGTCLAIPSPVRWTEEDIPEAVECGHRCTFAPREAEVLDAETDAAFDDFLRTDPNVQAVLRRFSSERSCQQILRIADVGSAQELGDAEERLRAIHALIEMSGGLSCEAERHEFIESLAGPGCGETFETTNQQINSPTSRTREEIGRENQAAIALLDSWLAMPEVEDDGSAEAFRRHTQENSLSDRGLLVYSQAEMNAALTTATDEVWERVITTVRNYEGGLFGGPYGAARREMHNEIIAALEAARKG